MGVIRQALEPLRQLRRRAHAAGLANADGGAAAISRWREVCHEKVVAGLFEGMHYAARWGDAAAPAKWLGSYEEELRDPIDALVVSDCEGAEKQLIDPSLVPALSASDLVVELHEREDPSLGDYIAERFPRHEHAFVPSRARDVRDHAALLAIDAAYRALIVRKFRCAQRWLVLTAPR